MSASALPRPFAHESLAMANARLARSDARARVCWALERFGSGIVLASSFGVQAAVMLHLVTRERPEIPVVLVDTGYLFPETYRFADALTARLGLNLRVYRPELSAAWFEARHGRLWEGGLEGVERYNRERKVAPMERALHELGAQAWFSGLRREQAGSRADAPVLQSQRGRVKVHPIVDWSDRDVHRYLQAHDLPYHPLREQGYVSVGDWHTTRRLADGMAPEETRFFGLKRECGLHEAG